MPDLAELIRKRVERAGDPAILSLWKDISVSYEDGGPIAVKERLLNSLNQLSKGAQQEIKGVNIIIPKKRKRRK